MNYLVKQALLARTLAAFGLEGKYVRMVSNLDEIARQACRRSRPETMCSKIEERIVGAISDALHDSRVLWSSFIH